MTLSGQTVNVDVREILRALRERRHENEPRATSPDAAAGELEAALDNQQSVDDDEQQPNPNLNRQDSGTRIYGI